MWTPPLRDPRGWWSEKMYEVFLRTFNGPWREAPEVSGDGPKRSRVYMLQFWATGVNGREKTAVTCMNKQSFLHKQPRAAWINRGLGNINAHMYAQVHGTDIRPPATRPPAFLDKSCFPPNLCCYTTVTVFTCTVQQAVSQTAAEWFDIWYSRWTNKGGTTWDVSWWTFGRTLFRAPLVYSVCWIT